MSKVCSKCNIEKDESEFYKIKRHPHGLSYSCKVCDRKYSREKQRLRNYKRIEIGAKVCSKCNLKKNVSEFQGDKYRKDGLRAECKNCSSLYLKEYRELNKEKVLMQGRINDQKRYKKNKEVILNKNKKYYNSNKEKVLSTCRKWALNNVSKRRASSLKWANNATETLSPSYIKSVLKQNGFPKDASEQYPALIELKKLELLNKRTIKILSNENKV